MRRPNLLRACALAVLALFVFTACGSKANPSTSPNGSEPASEGAGTEDCSGTAMAIADAGLPPGFPDLDEAKLTAGHMDGPTTVVEGFYEADLQSAYNEYKEALENAGYAILFDEIEEHDSEISWKSKDETATGQVALRDECMQEGTTFLKITSRPAS